MKVNLNILQYFILCFECQDVIQHPDFSLIYWGSYIIKNVDRYHYLKVSIYSIPFPRLANEGNNLSYFLHALQ